MSTVAKRTRDFHSIDLAVAVCTPGARMFVVATSVFEDGGSYSRTEPVLAISATIRATLSRAHEPDGDFRGPPSLAEALAQGWTHDATETVVEPLVWEGEFGALAPVSMAHGGANAAHRVVVATWLPEEDEGRLAPIMERIEAEARENAREYAGRKEALIA